MKATTTAELASQRGARGITACAFSRLTTTWLAIFIKSALVLSGFLAAELVVRGDRASEVRLSEALHTETIPHLKIDSVHLREALAMIRGIWERTHPAEPFPVGLSDYDKPHRSDARDRQISLDLHNVTYIAALRFIGDLTYRRFREERGYVRLEEQIGIVESWYTQLHRLPPAALAGLGLRADSKAGEVQRAFEKLGITFPRGLKAELSDSGRSLLVTNLESEQEKISGIILLLTNGYKITK